MKKSEQYILLRNQAEWYSNRGHYLIAKQLYIDCLKLTRIDTQKHRFTMECIEEMNEYIIRDEK